MSTIVDCCKFATPRLKFTYILQIQVIFIPLKLRIAVERHIVKRLHWHSAAQAFRSDRVINSYLPFRSICMRLISVFYSIGLRDYLKQLQR